MVILFCWMDFYSAAYLVNSRTIALALCAVGVVACDRETVPPAPVELLVGHDRILADLALDPAAQMRGLSHRDRLEGNRGMLFVLKRPADVCMWMKDTRMPLSAAFLDDHGTIINIADMEPQTETQHCSAAPATFVLEVQGGWFADRRIGPGADVSGIAHLRQVVAP